MVFLKITEFVHNINLFLWNGPALFLLILSGLIFSISSGFFQIRHIRTIFKETLFSKNKNKAEGKTITQFQALCTTLASTLGIGNIAGVSYAIYEGGPGSIFWMWLAAIISMMTSFAENALGIYYREKSRNGEWVGGPMYTIKNGMGKMIFFKPFTSALAFLFSVFCIISSFGIGNLNQINKMTENVIYSLNFIKFTNPNSVLLFKIFISILIFIICGRIIFKDVKIIAKLSEKVVPFMVLLFMLGCFTVLFYYKENLISSIKLIFVDAFSFSSIKGGVFGSLINKIIVGCKRGVFSNEAGLGTAVLINSKADGKSPQAQGMFGIILVFIDTIVVCTISALVVLVSNSYLTDTTGNGVTIAFNNVFGSFGAIFVSICVFLFAITSVISWCQYGVMSIKYLKTKNGEFLYKLIFTMCIPLGVFLSPDFVWNICDIFNALMLLPNIISLLVLYPVYKKLIMAYKKV